MLICPFRNILEELDKALIWLLVHKINDRLQVFPCLVVNRCYKYLSLVTVTIQHDSLNSMNLPSLVLPAWNQGLFPQLTNPDFYNWTVAVNIKTQPKLTQEMKVTLHTTKCSADSNVFIRAWPIYWFDDISLLQVYWYQCICFPISAAIKTVY